MGIPSDKEFKTYDEMIEILKTRNIVFDDEENAKYILKNNPYYTLVNGYKDIFIKKKVNNNELDDFQETNFNDLKFVYDFDREISKVFYKYLNMIEESFKSVLSYGVAKNIGYLDTEYLDSKYYKLGEIDKKGQSERDRLLFHLNKCKNSKNYKTIVHYRKNYQNIPPWILSKKLTFGKLNNWYKLSRHSVQKEVYTHFLDSNRLDSLDNTELFQNLIFLVHDYRNNVAHGDRILQYTSSRKVKVSLLTKYLNNNYSKTMARKSVGSIGLQGAILSIFLLLSNRNTVRDAYVDELNEVMNTMRLKRPQLYAKTLKANRTTQHFLDNYQYLI